MMETTHRADISTMPLPDILRKSVSEQYWRTITTGSSAKKDIISFLNVLLAKNIINKSIFDIIVSQANQYTDAQERQIIEQYAKKKEIGEGDEDKKLIDQYEEFMKQVVGVEGMPPRTGAPAAYAVTRGPEGLIAVPEREFRIKPVKKPEPVIEKKPGETEEEFRARYETTIHALSQKLQDMKDLFDKMLKKESRIWQIKQDVFHLTTYSVEHLKHKEDSIKDINDVLVKLHKQARFSDEALATIGLLTLVKENINEDKPEEARHNLQCLLGYYNDEMAKSKEIRGKSSSLMQEINALLSKKIGFMLTVQKGKEAKGQQEEAEKEFIKAGNLILHKCTTIYI